MGGPSLSPGGATVRVRPDLTQEKHVEGLPVGTRGGALVPHTFPVDGEYEITIRLARDRNEHIEGLFEPHELDLLLDGGPLKTFTVEPASKQRGGCGEVPSPDNMDSHLKLRVPVTAGPHTLGVTFPKQSRHCYWKPPASHTKRISTTTAIRAFNRPSTRSRSSVRTTRRLRATRRADAASS